MTTVIQGCAVATVDAAGTEHPDGHVVLDGDRIAAVGPGPADPAVVAVADTVVDGRGCLATPGLVNTHHHLYQWATRGLAQQEDLFGWLTTLYPVWEGLDEEVVGAAAAAGLGWLALTGCTSTTDHHYVFPRDGGDVLGATVRAAREVGLRFHPTRGSMDLGRSRGGLPPDSLVETTDAALAGTLAALDEHHDPAPGSMLRMGVAPCSPFSVTEALMREAAALARDRGARLHTHLAETLDEEDFCRSSFGCSPTEYADRLGWLGGDVWLAHAVHLHDGDVRRLAGTGTAVAHCPTSNARLGSGLAPVAEMRRQGVAVGLGVDGSASNEESSLATEMHAAVMVARLREGPAAMTARDALALATVGGARVLGREDELGSLEPGKLGDVALWRVDGLGHAGCEDPVAALVLGSRPPLARLLVGGATVVEDDTLVTADQHDLAQRAVTATRDLQARSGR
ncbi:8-oxoguanine deaminase [Nocardioides sp.]|uniref:8-oxoguanine deaminase n=1 Tax=Nocardioides sp. TaxID=35761 RepID=UPI0035289410